MRQLKWIVWVPMAIVGGLLFVAIGGAVVQALWNWLLPALFGWPQITFWQALGLLALCRILFGGLGSHAGGPRSNVRRRWSERWNERFAERVTERLEQMTPEERERFKQRMRERWGFDASGREPGPEKPTA